MTLMPLLVVALTLANEMIGAMGVVARRAACFLCRGDGSRSRGIPAKSNIAGARTNAEPGMMVAGDCYTFCDTAARILLRSMLPLRFVLDARKPIK